MRAYAKSRLMVFVGVMRNPSSPSLAAAACSLVSNVMIAVPALSLTFCSPGYLEQEGRRGRDCELARGVTVQLESGGLHVLLEEDVEHVVRDVVWEVGAD